MRGTTRRMRLNHGAQAALSCFASAAYWYFAATTAGVFPAWSTCAKGFLDEARPPRPRPRDAASSSHDRVAAMRAQFKALMADLPLAKEIDVEVGARRSERAPAPSAPRSSVWRGAPQLASPGAPPPVAPTDASSASGGPADRVRPTEGAHGAALGAPAHRLRSTRLRPVPPSQPTGAAGPPAQRQPPELPPQLALRPAAAVQALRSPAAASGRVLRGDWSLIGEHSPHLQLPGMPTSGSAGSHSQCP